MKLDLDPCKEILVKKTDRLVLKDASRKRTLSLGLVKRKKARKIAG